jgi:hypothetical protein
MLFMLVLAGIQDTILVNRCPRQCATPLSNAMQIADQLNGRRLTGWGPEARKSGGARGTAVRCGTARYFRLACPGARASGAPEPSLSSREHG